MPAHNEGRVVAGAVRRVRETLPGAAVVVVDDGSSDDTGAQAAAAGARVVTLPFNCGEGVALLTGLTSAYRAGATTVITCVVILIVMIIHLAFRLSLVDERCRRLAIELALLGGHSAGVPGGSGERASSPAGARGREV